MCNNIMNDIKITKVKKSNFMMSARRPFVIKINKSIRYENVYMNNEVLSQDRFLFSAR